MFFSSPGSAAASTTVATLTFAILVLAAFALLVLAAFTLLVLASSSTAVSSSGGVLVSSRRIVGVFLILDDCESLFVCVMLSVVEVVGLVATVTTTATSATSSASLAILVVMFIGRADATFGVVMMLALNNGGSILNNWSLGSSSELSCSDWLGNGVCLFFDLGLFLVLMVVLVIVVLVFVLVLMFVSMVVNSLLSEKGLTLSSL